MHDTALTECAPLLDVLPLGVTLVDPGGVIRYANEDAASAYDLPVDEFTGRSLEDPVWLPQAPDGEPLSPEELPHAQVFMRNEPVRGFEYSIRLPDDRRVLIAVDAAPVRDVSGAVVAVMRSFREITEERARECELIEERQAALGALERSETMFRSVVEQSSLGVYMGRLDGTALLYNPAMHEITGYTMQEVNESGWLDLVYLDKKERARAKELARRAREGEIDYFEIPITRKDGERRWASFSLKRMEIDGEELSVALVADIDERKRAEESQRRTMEQLGEVNRELAVVASASKAALATLEMDELLHSVLREVVEAFDAGKAAMLLKRGDVLRVERTSVGLSDDTIGIEIPLSEGIAGYVARTRETVYVEDVTKDPRALVALFQKEGMRTVLSVPLVSGEDLIGVLHLAWRESHPYDEHEHRVLEIVADRVALGVANAHLYEETRLARQYSDALGKVTQSLSSTLDFDEILRIAVREMLGVMGCEAAAVYLTHEGGGWVVAHAEGFGGRVETGARFRLEEVPALERAVKERRPVVIGGEERETPDEPETAAAYPLRSYIVVPLRAEGEIVGAITFGYCGAPATFSPADVDFATKMADAVSVAVRNARSFAEQRRIADTLQQALLSVPSVVPPLEVGHVYLSGTRGTDVGGDFFDVFGLGEGVVAVLLGDAAGKGLQAATLAALVKSAAKALCYREDSPAAVLAHLNDLVFRNSAPDVFVTAFLGFVHTREDRIVFSSGGHPAPLLSDGGKIRRLQSFGLILGAFEAAGYKDAEARFGPEALVFVYSDGMTEARSAQGELFGEERLEEFLRGYSGDVEPLPELLLDRVRAWTGGELRDDVAALSLGCQG